METNSVPGKPRHRHLFSLCITLRLQQIFLSPWTEHWWFVIFPPCFLLYIFHNPEAHWWTRLEFSWHRTFDLDDGFLPNYLLVLCVYVCVPEFVSVCVYLCLCLKINRAIRGLSLCGPDCVVVTVDFTDRRSPDLSIATGSAMWARCGKPSCERLSVQVHVLISLPLFLFAAASWMQTRLGCSFFCTVNSIFLFTSHVDTVLHLKVLLLFS